MVWRGRSKKNKTKKPSTFINPILCTWCSSDTGLNSWTEAHTLLPVPWLLKPGHQLQHSTPLLIVFPTKVPILNEQYRLFTKTSKFISKNPGDRDRELFSYLQRKKPSNLIKNRPCFRFLSYARQTQINEPAALRTTSASPYRQESPFLAWEYPQPRLLSNFTPARNCEI